MVKNDLVKSSLGKNKKNLVESDLLLKNRQFVRKKNNNWVNVDTAS